MRIALIAILLAAVALSAGAVRARTHIYSLSTGEQKAVFFGSRSTLSTAAGLLIVQNESGQVDVYDLKTLEKRTQLTFPYHVSACAFSADGARLLILAANQVAYVFDVHSLDKPDSPVTAAK